LETFVCFLAQGERIIKPDGSIIRRGRTLEEARALIEQSFGNYVGSEVMVAARQKVAQLQEEIARLEKETTKDSANSLESRLTKDELQEYTMLKEGVQEAKRMMRELRREVEVLRADMVHPLLENCSDSHPPFICLNYFEQLTGKESLVPALFVGKVPRPSYIDSLVVSKLQALKAV
jgi:metal-responsive CopG/Arc/MetJ family transcriptional regulator